MLAALGQAGEAPSPEDQVTTLPLRLLVQGLGYVFPNFQVFNLADQIGIGQAIDPLVFVRVGGYAMIYIAVFGGLAVYSFSKREI